MDWNVLGPVGTFLGLVGGGVAWTVNLWLKRADRKEDRMIERLKSELAKQESETEEERKARLAWEKRAIAWYKQLLDAGITPTPPWGDVS